VLRRGSGFTVTITKRGFIGERLIRTVKHYGHTRAVRNRIAGNPFKKRALCIPVGASRPAKACSATPPTGP
jgi:hypothetical protein